MRLEFIEKFYYGFISSICILIFAIVLGNFLKDFISYFIITPEEYVSKYSWRLQVCSRIDNKDNYEKCIANIKKEILLERKYNFKRSLIEFLGYSITLLIIFLYHYRKFKIYK